MLCNPIPTVIDYAMQLQLPSLALQQDKQLRGAEIGQWLLQGPAKLQALIEEVPIKLKPHNATVSCTDSGSSPDSFAILLVWRRTRFMETPAALACELFFSLKGLAQKISGPRAPK